MVIFLTIGLSFTLKEVPGANFLLTVCAHKVLRMPCAAHGSHHLDKQNVNYSFSIFIHFIIDILDIS